MDLSRSRMQSPRVEWRDASASTNLDLRVELEGQAGAWPHLSCLLTDNQTAGRGRLDRTWNAAPGTALAVSVLVAPPGLDFGSVGDAWSWLPLIAGDAMATAVRGLVPVADKVSVKWPNDVLIDGRKVSGILAELTPHGVILGSGVNLTMTEVDLPVPTATSLLLAGAAETDIDAVLSAYLEALAENLALWQRSLQGDRSELVRRVARHCSTLGSSVRVELPDDTVIDGRAMGLDELGRLIVEVSKNRQQFVVAAGDITHLRVNKEHDSSARDGADYAPGAGG